MNIKDKEWGDTSLNGISEDSLKSEGESSSNSSNSGERCPQKGYPSKVRFGMIKSIKNKQKLLKKRSSSCEKYITLVQSLKAPEKEWEKQSIASKNTNVDSGIHDSHKRAQESDKGGNMLDKQNWDCFEQKFELFEEFK